MAHYTYCTVSWQWEKFTYGFDTYQFTWGPRHWTSKPTELVTRTVSEDTKILSAVAQITCWRLRGMCPIMVNCDSLLPWLLIQLMLDFLVPLTTFGKFGFGVWMCIMFGCTNRCWSGLWTAGLKLNKIHPKWTSRWFEGFFPMMSKCQMTSFETKLLECLYCTQFQCTQKKRNVWK